MLILPIVNRKRILNVCISLKNAEKVNERVHLPGVSNSNIIVNEHMFSRSLYNEGSEDLKKSVVDFIRNNSLLYRRNFTITTKAVTDTDVYDVYRVDYPLHKVNDNLEILYGAAVTDMMMETPDKPRGKYISLKDLGFDDFLTDEKILKLDRITSTATDGVELDKLYRENGVDDLVKTIEFMNLFDCTVVGEASIPEDVFIGVLDSFKKVHTRDAKSMQRYYNIALGNKDIYSKLSHVNKILYNKPYSLIGSESQKKAVQFVKVNQMSGGDNNKSA